MLCTMINKLLTPLYTNRNRLLQLNYVFFRNARGCKTRQTGVSTSVRSEVGTRVKPLGEKVKETTKTASYLGIILLGVGVTGSLFYAVFQELFSSSSPNNVYSKAVDKCKADVRIQDKLGLPISAFGAETSRRRRQHVTHAIFERDGRQCIRMRFHLKGSFHKGTVHLEMIKNDSGRYEYRFLFVQVEDLLHTSIVLEDNRDKYPEQSHPPIIDLELQ